MQCATKLKIKEEHSTLRWGSEQANSTARASEQKFLDSATLYFSLSSLNISDFIVLLKHELQLLNSKASTYGQSCSEEHSLMS
jgi:hypothetical protein